MQSAVERPVALVTSANKGIGYEVAAQLADEGAEILLAARDAARGERAAEALRGGTVTPVVLDVTDPASAAATAAWIDEASRTDRSPRSRRPARTSRPRPR